MEYLVWNEAKDWVQQKEGFVCIPDFERCDFLKRWLANCGELDSPRMCRVLNLINNQGIEYITLKDNGYVAGGTWVPLNYLSVSEKLFFCAELARQKQTHIYLYKGLKQLSAESEGIFYREFVNCEYVHLLFRSDGHRYIFRKRGGVHD